MAKIKKMSKEKCCSKRMGCGQCGAVYGLGLIGAAIYYIGQATTFWMGVLGLLKAFVWPVFLVHAVLKFVGA
jgi:hypothetical protein